MLTSTHHAFAKKKEEKEISRSREINRCEKWDMSWVCECGIDTIAMNGNQIRDTTQIQHYIIHSICMDVAVVAGAGWLADWLSGTSYNNDNPQYIAMQHYNNIKFIQASMVLLCFRYRIWLTLAHIALSRSAITYYMMPDRVLRICHCSIVCKWYLAYTKHKHV